MFLRYGLRFRKWLRYAFGSSYQHVPQGQGAHLIPGTISGYFNDLRPKADWTGTLIDGVPAVSTDTNPAFLFPIVIFQWGLGNWDKWLDSERADSARLDRTLVAARWAAKNLTEEGGWECWTGLVRPTITPYSAMAQGEGVSLLVRAATIENRDESLGAARRAARFLLASGRHGLICDHGDWSSLEEYPGEAFPAVLNGWIFALLGLHDLGIATNEVEFSEAAKVHAAHLAKVVSRYDNGFWSTYDLAGNIASPFYHELHIAQLRTLSILFPRHAEAYLSVADRFDSYRNRKLNRYRSIGIKIVQKVLQPAVGEMA